MSRRAEEIFGPILPIMTLKDKDEMVEFIKAGETPLAIYLFTQSKKESDYGASHSFLSFLSLLQPFPMA